MVRFGESNPVSNEQLQILIESGLWDLVVNAPDYILLARDIRAIRSGEAEVRSLEHLVDCDLDPMIPDSRKIEAHQKDGKVRLERRGDALLVDGVEIELYLDPAQQSGNIVGTKLRDKFSDKLVLNACVLDYLIEHPELIPESWKKDEQGRTRFIFFWGTIFRNFDGGLGVGCLFWDQSEWCLFYNWLDHDFNNQYPAAMLAMPTGRQASPPAPDSFASSLVNPGP
jgi:hypothetical protein